jgi:CRISPR-associated protein Csm2
MVGPYKGNPKQTGRPGGGYAVPPATLPSPHSIAYYDDTEKKKLNPKWVDGEAEQWAKSFRELRTSQMRKFYDELKAIERRILRGKDIHDHRANFERDRALIMIFKAKAVYAEKRGVSPRAFTQFIFDHMASLKDLEDFRAFLKVFEAVVAFHRYFADEK